MQRAGIDPVTKQKLITRGFIWGVAGPFVPLFLIAVPMLLLSISYGWFQADGWIIGGGLLWVIWSGFCFWHGMDIIDSAYPCQARGD